MPSTIPTQPTKRWTTRRGLLKLIAGSSLPVASRAQDFMPLPDGEISSFQGMTARLISPTTRYQHAVLGDAIEASGIIIERHGRPHVYHLNEDAVFEDRRARLWDLNGDGVPKVVVVKSYLDRGAALAVFSITEKGIEALAESPAIGTRYRWLNPIGAEDFSGNGDRLIAAVITPHLSGSLRFYKLSGNALAEVARIDGYTNHILGSRDLDLARVITREGKPMIVIPTLDRRSLALLSFQGGTARVVARQAAPARIISLAIGLDNMPRVVLEDGKTLKMPLD